MRSRTLCSVLLPDPRWLPASTSLSVQVDHLRQEGGHGSETRRLTFRLRTLPLKAVSVCVSEPSVRVSGILLSPSSRHWDKEELNINELSSTRRRSTTSFWYSPICSHLGVRQSLVLCSSNWPPFPMCVGYVGARAGRMRCRSYIVRLPNVLRWARNPGPFPIESSVISLIS